MEDNKKTALIEKYEHIESLYRQYKYAEDVSKKYLFEYLKEVQALPCFCVPHILDTDDLDRKVRNENR